MDGDRAMKPTPPKLSGSDVKRRRCQLLQALDAIFERARASAVPEGGANWGRGCASFSGWAVFFFFLVLSGEQHSVLQDLAKST